MNSKIILMTFVALATTGVHAKIAVKKSIISPNVMLEMKTSDGHPIADWH